jgi:hypothetical protein
MKKQILYPGFITRVFSIAFDMSILVGLTELVGLCISKYACPWSFKEIMIKNNLNPNDINDLLKLSSSYTFKTVDDINALFLCLIIPGVVKLLVILAYFLGFWFAYSRTPAAFVTQMIIVDSETFEKPTRWQFVKRSIASSLFIIGIWFVLFTKKKQALHDLISGTTVIKS